MNETWIEKTELYVNGGMDAEARLLFEEEIAANEELSAYVATYRHIETAMGNRESHNEQEEVLKSSLKKLNAVYFDTEQHHSAVKKITEATRQAHHQPKIQAWKTIAIAASVIGIIALSVLWFMQDKKRNEPAVAYTNEDSAINNIKTDTTGVQNVRPVIAKDNVDTVRKQPLALTLQKREELFNKNFKTDAVPENVEGPLEDAFTYYDEQQYDNAATEFTTADLSSTRGSETDTKLTAFYAGYYAGVSYLAGNKTNKAIATLNHSLAIKPDALSGIKNQWYLGLAYLKTGEMDKAVQLFTQIASNNIETAYKAKAATILAEIQ